MGTLGTDGEGVGSDGIVFTDCVSTVGVSTGTTGVTVSTLAVCVS